MMPPVIGIIGGGQLGRMLAMAAARLNARTIILEPQADCPAAQVANRQIVAAYDDPAALAELADACSVITYEFENVPVAAANTLAASVPVYPPPKALEISQDRLTEKQFLTSLGIRTAQFRPVASQSDLEKALAEFGGEAVLKTRRFGYDGKGQKRFQSGTSPEGAYDALGGGDLILESFVAFDREISVIAARNADGQIVCYDPAENVHQEGILHTSTLPAAISRKTADEAKVAAAQLLAALDYVGVLGLEFFVAKNGTLIANEFAPRVHNSGHWTEAACAISQFEQHIRAITGMPLGSVERHSDCVMQNLIGDDIRLAGAWMQEPDVVVHLYGKTEPRPGRKMGHVTRLLRHNHGQTL
jgi:5-(carboxyamino)imidazole ribonucleotide synthase